MGEGGTQVLTSVAARKDQGSSMGQGVWAQPPRLPCAGGHPCPFQACAGAIILFCPVKDAVRLT